MLRRPSPRLAALVLAPLLLGAAAGCASDEARGADGTSTTPTTTTALDATSTGSAGRWTRPDCDLGPARTTPPTEAVAGVPSDRTLTSFDGTHIRIHWFPAPSAAATPAPTILMGPGWGLSGDTSRSGSALFGALSIGAMNDAGYNVLTWDPRGFGQSGGFATVDAPDHEGRDAQALVDWVASRPEALLDGRGDPRVGMVGWSYGGGIQLTLASIDCRVDALVPGLAWHSLTTSLDKTGIVKTGWAGLLSSVAASGHLDPHIPSAESAGERTGTLGAADLRWFADRGPGDRVARVDVPTLFVQGTVDTLFTLDEAITNERILRRRHVPTAMLWFCGGHGTCLTSPGDPHRVSTATLAWLDRYLRDDTSARAVPGLDLVDQDGQRWVADRYPTATFPTGTPAKTITATGHGTLELARDTAAAPFRPPAGAADLLSGLVSGITPTKAGRAVEVPIDPGDAEGLVLGAPRLHLEYSGTVPAGDRPTRVFAQLVDDDRGVVVGNQVTPIRVTLDGKRHTADADLEVVAQHVRPGHTLTLQLIATTDAYAEPRLGGSVTFDSIEVRLPLPAGMARAG
jgi:ABC-2 type transport system ATP-binding protein